MIMISWRKTPDSKVHGANMGPIWGRQDPGGPHVGPMNFAIWDTKLAANYPSQWVNLNAYEHYHFPEVIGDGSKRLIGNFRNRSDVWN